MSSPLIPISLSGSTTTAAQGTQDQPVLDLLREGEEDGRGGELPGLIESHILQARPVTSAAGNSQQESTPSIAGSTGLGVDEAASIKTVDHRLSRNKNC